MRRRLGKNGARDREPWHAGSGTGKGNGHMTDKEIVEMYWQRDEAAISETRNQYHRYLSKIAYQFLFNEEDVEECVSDTYLAAWNSMPEHRPEVLSAYLGKLVRRISIDLIRKKNRQKRKSSEYDLSLEELGDVFSDGNTPETAFDVAELGRVIGDFLRTLKPEVRTIFIGRYYYLDPVREVARYNGVSVAKAKTVLHRTRKQLKEYLEKEGYEV